MKNKMKVDIWSDVRCPFCYIGKRKFDAGLEKFSHKDQVEVSWHSFELDPSMKTETDMDANNYLAERKGISPEQARQMHQHAARMAAEAGLQFNFDRSVMANSFNAHRLIQLAKTKGVGDEAEEQLFKAHFTDGKNIDDFETLVQIGVAARLDPQDLRNTLSSSAFSDEVRQDELDAQTIGIRGVPFFVFNNQYAVSGAQGSETFLHTLEKSFASFEKENKKLIITEGESCSPDGDCS
jgi:predicted DsbA family dithiol-disulfide isomerase